MTPAKLCPCGSGRSQFNCCGDHPKSQINVRLFVIWSFIILLGSGIGAIAFSRFQDDAPSPASGPIPAPIQLSGGSGVSGTFPSIINPGGTSITLGTGSGSEVPAPVGISNPSPWQYDTLTDRHYDPNHAHWHGGPPPSNPITAPPGLGPTSGSKVSAPPNIPNPQPWQFDAATYRYYDPGHAHWHSGRPPNDPNAAADPTSGGRVSAPPNVPYPSPWQYDSATYRYYDPNHGHWHSGPPPNDPNAPPVAVSGTEAPAPPNISNPSPWQYDVGTDRHYDPNHAHWHDGPPPPN